MIAPAAMMKDTLPFVFPLGPGNSRTAEGFVIAISNPPRASNPCATSDRVFADPAPVTAEETDPSEFKGMPVELGRVEILGVTQT